MRVNWRIGPLSLRSFDFYEPVNLDLSPPFFKAYTHTHARPYLRDSDCKRSLSFYYARLRTCFLSGAPVCTYMVNNAHCACALELYYPRYVCTHNTFGMLAWVFMPPWRCEFYQEFLKWSSMKGWIREMILVGNGFINLKSWACYFSLLSLCKLLNKSSNVFKRVWLSLSVPTIKV